MIAFAAGKPGYGLLHARRRDDDAFVGGCGLYPLQGTGDIEIAYRLPNACWGQGYATEMARAVVAHGLSGLALARIVGRHVSGERGVAARAPQDRHARGGHGGPTTGTR